MKKILLVNPSQNVSHIEKEVSIYPSGALLLIGTMCKNEGHNVKIIDTYVDNINNTVKMKKLITDFAPNIVGITINTFQTKNAKLWLKIIKEIDNKILTVVGGPHPSCLGLDIFNEFQNIDISVIGEGEFTFLEIVEGKPFAEIKGICYGNKINEQRPIITDLSYIPLINYDLIDISKYRGMYGKGNSMFIMASRGCPSHCIYCNKSVFGNRVRYRPPVKVIEEIRYLNKKYGITHIHFSDDTFNLNRKWIEEIFELIISNKLNTDITYGATFRANKSLIDKNLLILAKKANVTSILYGVESGNQEMLDNMRKNLTIDELKQAFKLTQEVGIESIASFIIGLPGESESTIRDTVNLWKELNPTHCGFTLATPFPNTDFQKELILKNHLLNYNYDEYYHGGCYVRTDELTGEQLNFYSIILILGHSHKCIHKLPYFLIGRNKTLCKLFITIVKIYREIT